jgi:ADP-ribose pyrophosphatase YjhB (NUDIX family)
MNYKDAIEAYRPANEQEAQDQRAILEYIAHFGDQVLLRDNAIAHLTSSGFIMNEARDKALLVHHNIRGVWGWTGGHADGDPDLLHVALKEAAEETGVSGVRPFTGQVASIDILPVYGHVRKSRYVNTHLHLSVAYIVIADEDAVLQARPEENSGVGWFALEQFTDAFFDASDVYLYNKLIDVARNRAG